MKKVIVLFGLILCVTVSIFACMKIKNNNEYKERREKIHTFLQSSSNRVQVYSRAVNLNRGKSANTCVFFISEVLRRNDYKVPDSMCNVVEFISFLEKKGWKKETNYKKLQPGDLVFTKDSTEGNSHGTPNHVYVFMGWVEEGKYDYAYIADNQAKDYNNKIYHIRNVTVVNKINGYTKDPFSFFMKK
ncbi:hypothetical protein [Clostridium oceanicum]|uniref:Bacteriophage peptidoglycan hydrolase n=1 Tax=Clostridium oceanicum TaxID=1543 RepID=A0ABP3UQP3_9CLOT